MHLLLLMATLVIAPVQDALKRFDERTPVGSALRSAEWALVPAELRNRAQFSAGVESARVLQRIQDGISDILSQRRNENGALTERSGFIRDLTQLAREEGLLPQDPKDVGTIRDITSESRVKLIYEQQVQQAYGYAEWKSGNDPDTLDAWPCWELVRLREARVPRDWPARWMEAGGKFTAGRMIARKDDGIWSAISRFGNPWPPFDFNSGMWVEEISRQEAADLGVIQLRDVIASDPMALNESLEADVSHLGVELVGFLQKAFAGKIRVEGGTAAWIGGAA